MTGRPPGSPLFPYTTLFRSGGRSHRQTCLDGSVALAAGYLHAKSFAPVDSWALQLVAAMVIAWRVNAAGTARRAAWLDRKSTRLNSSHTVISYAVFCLKKKT